MKSNYIQNAGDVRRTAKQELHNYAKTVCPDCQQKNVNRVMACVCMLLKTRDGHTAAWLNKFLNDINDQIDMCNEGYVAGKRYGDADDAIEYLKSIGVDIVNRT